jgi:valyl-tRNA synthetase
VKDKRSQAEAPRPSAPNLRAIPQVALDWSNNLAREWEVSRQTIKVHGDPAYQHTDKQICVSDEAKKYAAECLANVATIQFEMVAGVAESRPSAEEVNKLAREFAISVRGEYPSILEYYLDYESAINVMTAWWEWMQERITRP